MKPLSELINQEEPGIIIINEILDSADNQCELLPPSQNRSDVLLGVQVTTRSTLGAMAYDTGGLLVDHGWLRILGSGHQKLERDLTTWNKARSQGYYLFADDVVGGFFAINGGALGEDVQNVYYWAPDDIEWAPLEIGYTDFLGWAVSDELAKFYQELRWPDWKTDTAQVNGDHCFTFYPFLWTEQGSMEGSHREVVPVSQEFSLRSEMLSQLAKDSTT